MNRQNNRAKTSYGWLPISIILAIATVLFTYQLGREGLWIDELFSIRDATVGNIFDVYKETSARPLYYVLLNIWMMFGSSDAFLRSLSVIFALISVFLIYRLGRRLDGESTGLTAAALLTLSPLFINHAQEVRMYALSVCISLAGTVFLTEALLTHPEQSPSQKTIGSWALFRLLAIYTVPLNITLLLPDALIILWRFRKRTDVLLNFGAWLGLVVLLGAPSILTVSGDATPGSGYAKSRAQYLEPPGLKNLIYPLKFWMVPPQVVRLAKSTHWFYKLFTLLVAGVIGAGLIRKHKSPALVWTAAWLVLPLIPIIVYSHIGAQIWEPRYVLFVCPYLFLLIAAGFSRLWQQWRPAAATMGAIYLFAMVWAIHHYYDVQNREDFKFNVATIEQYEQPGDAIVWGYAHDDPLRYYYNGSAEVQWLAMSGIETTEALQQWVSQLPSNYERLWLVIDKPEKAVADEFREAIASKYIIRETYEDFGDFSKQFDKGSSVLLVSPLDSP